MSNAFAANTSNKQHSGGKAALLLNFLATVHLVWFYLSRVECHIRLLAYEQGRERTPFQYRLLLMEPMRWAHQSSSLQAIAGWLTLQRGFFPGGVRPEGLLQACIDLLCVAVTGIVTVKLYQLSSRTRLLQAYVYPLTLIMVWTTYSLLTMHSYRFIYDLPALAFFSLGLYLSYTGKHPLWFALVFVLGTLNRETTLLLLVFFIVAQCGRTRSFDWTQSYSASTLKRILPLAAFWLAWHLWVVQHFAANPTASQPRLSLNLALLAIPLIWPQILGTFAYALPLVVLYRRHIHDPVLCLWLFILPLWIVFMLYYGVVVETRIFGELIPYMACIAALVAEEAILLKLQSMNRLTERPLAVSWPSRVLDRMANQQASRESVLQR